MSLKPVKCFCHVNLYFSKWKNRGAEEEVEKESLCPS